MSDQQHNNNTSTEILLLKKDFKYMSDGIEEIKRGIKQINDNVGSTYSTKEELRQTREELEEKVKHNANSIKEIRDGFSRVLWLILTSVIGVAVIFVLRGGLATGL